MDGREAMAQCVTCVFIERCASGRAVCVIMASLSEQGINVINVNKCNFEIENGYNARNVELHGEKSAANSLNIVCLRKVQKKFTILFLRHFCTFSVGCVKKRHTLNLIVFGNRNLPQEKVQNFAKKSSVKINKNIPCVEKNQEGYAKYR